MCGFWIQICMWELTALHDLTAMLSSIFVARQMINWVISWSTIWSYVFLCCTWLVFSFRCLFGTWQLEAIIRNRLLFFDNQGRKTPSGLSPCIETIRFYQGPKQAHSTWHYSIWSCNLLGSFAEIPIQVPPSIEHSGFYMFKFLHGEHFDFKSSIS